MNELGWSEFDCNEARKKEKERRAMVQRVQRKRGKKPKRRVTMKREILKKRVGVGKKGREG